MFMARNNLKAEQIMFSLDSMVHFIIMVWEILVINQNILLGSKDIIIDMMEHISSYYIINILVEAIIVAINIDFIGTLVVN